MKRRIVILLLLLLLGAIVNIAVAWGCALWAPNPVLREFAVPTKLRDSEEQRGWLVDNSLQGNTPVKSVMMAFGKFAAPPNLRGIAYVSFESGFPVRSLEAISRRSADAHSEEELICIVAPAWLRSESSMPLPVRPIPAHFAINTLFYAAILWLLFAATSALRRWRRSKRGVCPACAYPVGASDLCTECGRPIPSALRGAARS